MDKRRELNPDEHFQAKQSPGLKETKRCCILTKIALFKPKIAEQLETRGVKGISFQILILVAFSTHHCSWMYLVIGTYRNCHGLVLLTL